MVARRMVQSEKPGIEQIWVTNQGTDAHVLAGCIGVLVEGLSYHVHGIVTDAPSTITGGHVSFTIGDGEQTVRCMAYEPTKNFRQIIRDIIKGDGVIAVGSYKKGSINLEKIRVVELSSQVLTRPPVCTVCNKRMTSDGTGKGYKCKKCGIHAQEPEIQKISRTLKPAWYEVPPTARRHLAKPLCRGEPEY
jgi:tRNA(Ile2)-agmatinylcytidine synthase